MLRIVTDVHSSQDAEDSAAVMMLLAERMRGRPEPFASFMNTLEGVDDSATDEEERPLLTGATVASLATDTPAPVRARRGRPAKVAEPTVDTAPAPTPAAPEPVSTEAPVVEVVRVVPASEVVVVEALPSEPETAPPPVVVPAGEPVTTATPTASGMTDAETAEMMAMLGDLPAAVTAPAANKFDVMTDVELNTYARRVISERGINFFKDMLVTAGSANLTEVKRTDLIRALLHHGA